LISGWLSDKLGKRKALTVFGYSLSAVAKPLYLLAGTWPAVLLLRFADRFGKGIRTAPRDALVADSIQAENRGFGFGLHRAADTLAATIGLAVAAAITYAAGPSAVSLRAGTFHLVIWISILPAVLGVLSLILIARDVPAAAKQTAARQVPEMRPQAKPRLSPRLAGFFIVVALFKLGNSSGSFLVLRSQNLGLSVFHVMSALLLFHALYTIVSTPACVPIGSDGGGCCSWAG
jgi:MFS family permease